MKNRLRFLLWWRWLIVVAAGVLLFGLSMVMAPTLTRQIFGLQLFRVVYIALHLAPNNLY